MKNLKLKSFFLALLLTCGVGQMWGYWINYPKIYFYNSGNWTPGMFLVGHNASSQGFNFTPVDNTKLWYVQPGINWSDLSEIHFGICGNGVTNWGYEGYTNFSSRWNNLTTNYATTEHTSNYDNYSFNYDYYYISYVNSSWTINSGNGAVPTYTAFLRTKVDERDGEGYSGIVNNSTTWKATFDFKGTHWKGEDGKTAQSTISNLNQNTWTEGGDTKYGYGNIPYTGEVTFTLKSITTGYELAGWGTEGDANPIWYTDGSGEEVTFNVSKTGSTDNEGVYVAFIRRKQYTVTLNDNGGSGGSGSKTVTYDRSANMTTSVSVPSKLGYAFQGYYTNQDGTGSMVINASGVWQKNVTNYTGTDGSSNPKWVRDGGVTLYAKWTQTVTLHDNHGGLNNGSISAIYNGVMSSKVVPTYTDHTLDQGYYAESGCSNKVMDLNGSLVASLTVSGTKWTSGSKWIHDGSSTIYAHWKVNAPGSISCTDNVVTIAVPTDATVHYTTDNSTPTGSSPTYDPSNKPVIASSGITVKAIAVQSGCTNSEVTSQAVTYTPVYTVAHTITNVTKSSGETSVLENKAYTAIYTDATGYDLPSTISVTVGGSPLTLTTDYTWSLSDGTGTLSILADKITGNVVITIVGDAETYDGTIDSDIDGGSGTDGAYTATYNETTIEITTTPSRTGYDVGGYYLNYNAEANPQYYNQIATTAGVLIESTAYTDATGHWTYTGDAPTIYASWVPKTYTITLDANRSGIPGTNGSTSFSVTIGSNNFDFDLSIAGQQGMTSPTKEGYTFAGYYDDPDDGEGTKVINADGSKPTTSYVNASGNWINSTDNLTLYAHWTDNGTYVFKGGKSGSETDWEEDDNWTKGVAPSAATDSIVILAPVVVPASATTSVKSVRIGSAGSYTPVGGSAITAAGKLTIPATAMLKVTNDVKNYDFSTSTASATTTSTLHIQSASSGNGALVWGKANSTPGEAQVDFYTKSSAAGNWEGANTDVNQYIGTPFSDANVLYNYYNAWTFKVNAAGTAWERLKGNETMYPFVGYNVIYDGAAGHIFEMDGTLVTNANVVVDAPNATESVLANSWVAPIKINAFEASDFSGPNATIYIFNSTSEKATEDASRTTGVTGGNYSTYTPGSALDTDFIPSMQSFSVTGGTGTVALDYSKLVKTPASHSNIGAMHAPRRYSADDEAPAEELEPKMERLNVYVSDENGWADLLKICIREDFVEDFENGFDARKMYGDDRAPMLYGISPDGRMAINCIPTADNHVVGFHGGSASNEYTFRFTYDGEDELYLLDNKTGIETPITAEDTYTFTSESGDSDLRFSIIRKVPATPTDLEELTGETLQDSGVQKIMYNGKLYIIRGGRIYDATGAVVK